MLEDQLSPFGKPCTVCGTENTDGKEDGDGLYWVYGYIGILPITLCGICYNGVVQMVRTLEGDYEDDAEA